MIVKKQIGKLPTYIGDYVNDKSYNKKNRVTLYGSEFESKIDGNTYAPATLDSEAKTVTFDTEHWAVISNGTSAFLAGEKLDQFSFEDNPEFVSADTDNEGKLLESTDIKGKKTFYGDVQIKGEIISETLGGKINTIEKTVINKVDKEVGKSLIDENVANSFTEKDSPEYTVVDTDNDGKIINSIDLNGIVTHNTKHIFRNGIEDVEGGLKKEILQYVKNSIGLIDWSEEEEIHLAIPKCAIVNITSSDGNSASWPASKTDNKKCWMQFWDKQGNYFKKRIILNAQGNSSLWMPKKNGTIDICNDEWVGDNTFKIKFGNWVIQDSFHLKAYYADYFVGVAPVGYSFFKDIIDSRTIYNNRDWKRYQLPSLETIGLNNQALADINDNKSLTDDATCFPQGFPSIVFLDGKFYGIYSWQIKKHRDNYQMEKANYSHIHLDGMISYDSLFNLNGALDWNIITGKKTAPSGGNEGFEIRNPKKLICIDGKKYDSDTHNEEIIGEDSENYDSTNEDMVNTAKVKASIISLSTYVPTLQSMVDNASSEDAIKAKVDEYFDTISVIDYVIFSDIVHNSDGFRKNWQWITYDGKKWLVEPYDLDGIFGWSGWGNISPTITQHYGGDDIKQPVYWVLKYHSTDLQSRYKELRDNKIVSVNNIISKMIYWIECVGSDNYEKEHEKWPYNKELYNYATETTHKDSIYRLYNWLTLSIQNCDKLYDYNN